MELQVTAADLRPGDLLRGGGIVERATLSHSPGWVLLLLAQDWEPHVVRADATYTVDRLDP